MKRGFCTFVGVDLGGSRGKTTALARLHWQASEQQLWVEEVATRAEDGAAFTDSVLIAQLKSLESDAVIAIDAPLVAPACGRCTEPVCPGYESCTVAEVSWLREMGEALVEQSRAADLDRVMAIGGSSSSATDRPAPQRRLAPYLHRGTEIHLHYQRGLLPKSGMGKGAGPIAARARHLATSLARFGFHANQNVIEVSPRATVQALFGSNAARGYKRDADPWTTRASIIESLSSQLRFSPRSRMAREEVLRNDHCFEALISAYTAFLWAKEGWTVPESAAQLDGAGWIWAPSDRA